jgi:predicted HAD superfamily Cof-like phosphohydrolase
MKDMISLHRVYGHNIGTIPKLPSDKEQDLRERLIKEEYHELEHALEWWKHPGNEELSDIADGAVDLIVVIIGMLVSYGIDFNRIWDVVHVANLTKVGLILLGGEKRHDGKQLKPEWWKHPDIDNLLRTQRPVTDKYA